MWIEVKNKKKDKQLKNKSISNVSQKIPKTTNIYSILEKKEKKVKKNTEQKQNDEFDINGRKKILCQNMIKNNQCKYGDKCSYAHNLNEQNILPLRKRAYDIIKNNIDLNNIDLHSEENLYKTLLELTKSCKNCNNNNCIGGYNCKLGVYNKNYS